MRPYLYMWPSFWRRNVIWIVAAILLSRSASRAQASAQVPVKQTSASASKRALPEPTVVEAQKFMNQAEKRLMDVDIKSIRASWVAETYITDDTEAVSADAD